jgi:hypothetical protein
VSQFSGPQFEENNKAEGSFAADVCEISGADVFDGNTVDAVAET